MLRKQSKLAILIKVSLFGLCFLYQATALTAASNSLYVATNGSDSNPGTISSPWLTLAYAARQLHCGDTLYVRGGTYNGGMGVTAGLATTCSSWNNSIKVQNYPNETVIVTSKGSEVLMGFSTGANYPAITPMYWTVQGLILDGAGQAADLGGPFSSLNVSYVRLVDLEVKNCQRACLYANGDHWYLTNLNIHDSGQGCAGNPSCPHAYAVGAYIVAPYSILDGGQYHDNAGGGAQFASSSEEGDDYAIARNASFYRNSTGDGSGNGGNVGLIMQHCTGCLMYNNIAYSNLGGGLSMAGSGVCIDCFMLNNTVYGNTGVGLLIGYSDTPDGGGAVRATIENNISFNNDLDIWIAGGNHATIRNNFHWDPILNQAATSTISNNTTKASLNFVNAAAHDFHLQSSSPAIGIGLNLSSIMTTDRDGNARQPSGAWDVGAYTYGLSQPSQDSVPPTVSLRVNPHQ